MRREADDTGPLAELEHWKLRMARFNSLVEQIKSQEGRAVIKALQLAKSKTLKVFLIFLLWPLSHPSFHSFFDPFFPFLLLSSFCPFFRRLLAFSIGFICFLRFPLLDVNCSINYSDVLYMLVFVIRVPTRQ